MAWEHIDKIFPSGYVVTAEGERITTEEVKKRQLKTISTNRGYASRNMFYKLDEWVWGENGEFAIINKFNALNLFPHVNGIAPLNVYGMCMVKNYCDQNNIFTPTS